MAEKPEPSQAESSERRLPTKAQIRAAAYGERTFAPTETSVPQNPQPAATPLIGTAPFGTASAAIAPAESAGGPDDDRWIVVAAQADG